MWSAIGACIRGDTHIRNNMPCQDALLIQHIEGLGLLCILSDGHGSKQCKYSDEGAKVALEVVASLYKNMNSQRGKKNIYNIIDQTKDIELPKKIERLWKEEIRRIHQKAQREVVKTDKDLFTLYGATLLTLLITEAFIFAMQLGDGDILATSKDGETDYFIQADHVLGVATYSLCMNDSWKHFNNRLVRIQKGMEIPELFLMSTDGYINSFINTQDFLQIGKDYLNILKQEGADFIREHLSQWLNETSKEGSGDDITFAMVYRL